MWCGRTGRTDEAREQLELMRRSFNRSNLAIFAGFVLGLLAWMDNLDGRYDEALGHARQALERSRERAVPDGRPADAGDPPGDGARALAGLAGPGQARDAAALLGAHESLLPAGHFVTTQDRDTREDAEAATRAVLGDTAYEAAYAEGGCLTLDEAAALAGL